MSLTFAIGDIHGCIDPMMRMIERVEAYAPAGKIVFLGDYVDRGPDSRSVIERLIAGPSSPDWQWITLKGNHEDMLTGAHDGRHAESWWLENGGIETLASYGGALPPEHLRWMESRPFIHTDQHRIFVHAGVREGRYLEEQTPHDLMWIRFADGVSGEYWGKHLVHGHTPSASNPRIWGNRTNVDGACVFGGRLACAVFDDEVPGGPVEFLTVRP